MTEPIYEDPVVAEIHAIREALLDECQGDMEEYRSALAAAKQRPVAGSSHHRSKTAQNTWMHASRNRLARFAQQRQLSAALSESFISLTFNSRNFDSRARRRHEPA